LGALRHFVGQAFETEAMKEEVEAVALLTFSTGVSSAELSLPIILGLVEKSQHK